MKERKKKTCMVKSEVGVDFNPCNEITNAQGKIKEQRSILPLYFHTLLIILNFYL
jgi:hypothetical protein